MLSRLSIQNYAIIERLEVDFSSRLNILTGETGAGKSIIVGALGLILGERAESNVLLNRERKCIVEGCFSGESGNTGVLQFLKEQELDVQEEIVVRREIAPNGKSRAFINDTPVNLSQLHQLSALLVDLHQQFDTMELGETDFQREVLDALAGNFPLLQPYRQAFSSWQAAEADLKILLEQRTRFNRELDYNQFQFAELDEAGFRENELEELEQELKLQTNAEEIKTALEKACEALEGGEEPVVKQLKTIAHVLQQFSGMQQDIPALVERIHSAYIELQDIADETARVSNHIQSDVRAIERINERMSLGYRLLKKHGVKTTTELLAIRNDLQEKLQAVLHIDEAIAQAESASRLSRLKVEELAGKMSASRKTQVKPLETQVNKMLAQVGMPNARLKVDIKAVSLNASGSDEISFLFDANKSNQFQPLRKVASGGELSRLMLCIKSLVARTMNLPTLIFDEIDTGISGEAARQVGMIMKDLAHARQVICITHQPQIAGRADAHFLVYKTARQESVTTGVRLLDQDERVVAIAKMLSGEKPTAAALENAREMVRN